MYTRRCAVRHTSSACFTQIALTAVALLYPVAAWTQAPLQSPLQERIEAAHPTPPPAHADLYNDVRVLLSPYSGASSEFLKRYEAYAASLAQGNVAAATAALARLQRGGERNDYEEVYLQLARYQLAQLRADFPAQAQHLRRMLDTVDAAQEVVLLPEGLETMALRALFKAEVQANQLREAMDTYARIDAAGDAEAVTAFRPGMEQIAALAENEQSYPVQALLDEEGRWSLGLHKRQFFIDAVQGGSVAEVVVACVDKTQTIAVEVEFGYTVPAALGACTLRFSGEPGTRFVLTQYRE